MDCIKINREAQAALIGGIILCGIGVFIALVTIVINIVVNGFFSFYKFYVGERTRSISLIADAYHTKTDIWSSVAVFVGLLGATMGFFVLDAVAGAAVSFFILLGGYELIKESHGVMQGKDPKMEKFSKFLESHLKILPDQGALVPLWLLNLQEMTKQKIIERVKKGLVSMFPVKLEDKDYETVYAKLEKDRLVESVQGKLRLTEKGRKELKILAEKSAVFLP